jgi:hypothetical protein
MKTKGEPVIACHPPFCICWVLPEVNYDWAKDVLMKSLPYAKKNSVKRNSNDNKATESRGNYFRQGVQVIK